MTPTTQPKIIRHLVSKLTRQGRDCLLFRIGDDWTLRYTTPKGTIISVETLQRGFVVRRTAWIPLQVRQQSAN